MLPLPAIGLAGAAAGLGGYQLYKKFFGPKLQSLRTVHPVTGAPVQVVVPVTSTKPVTGKAVVAPAPGYVGAATFTQPPKPVITPAATALPASAPVVITSPVPGAPPQGASMVVSTIADVQRALNTLGVAQNPSLVVDDKLGPATTAAVRKYQGYKGLPQDGVPGPATKAALQRDLSGLAATNARIGQSSAVADFYDTHKIDVHLVNMANVSGGGGSSIVTPESSLTAVQHGLNLLGASPPLVEDGKWGPASTAACKAFQIAHGMAADGVAGPKTKMAIGLALGAVTAQGGSSTAAAASAADAPDVAGEMGGGVA